MLIRTKSAKDTKRFAAMLAQEIISHPERSVAAVMALEGNLGVGKTTFVQGFARALGVKENILSPTFVLLKIYSLKPNIYNLKHLVHIDCYRLDSPRDLLHLGFKNLVKDKDAVILIEWADRVKKLMSSNAIWIKFKHGRKPQERILNFKLSDSREL